MAEKYELVITTDGSSGNSNTGTRSSKGSGSGDVSIFKRSKTRRSSHGIDILANLKEKLGDVAKNRTYDMVYAKQMAGGASEEEAKKFCDVILPKQCEKTENGFYLYNNYCNFYIKGEKKKYKIFDRRYHSKIIKYITDTYQIEGYEKIVLQKDYYGIEVEWKKI